MCAEQVAVHTGDLNVDLPSDVVSGHDVLINCAGHVAEGERFVSLVDRVVTTVESLPTGERPVCWFLAGAALLDIDASGRRGVELPKVKSTYWPHRVNFERLDALGNRLAPAVPGTNGRTSVPRVGKTTYLDRPTAGRDARVSSVRCPHRSSCRCSPL